MYLVRKFGWPFNMISEDVFYGHAVYNGISADITLPYRNRRIHSIEASVNGLNVKLPDATKCMVGGPSFGIANIGIRDVTVVDNVGGGLYTLQPNRFVWLSLSSNATVAGSWLVDGRIMSGSPNANVITLSGITTIIVSSNIARMDVRTTKLLSGVGTIQTDFTGLLSYVNEKFFSGSLSVVTAFTGQLTSLATTNIVSPSATGGGSGSLASPWTLKEAGQNLTAGQTAYLRGGNYPSATAHALDSITNTVVSGTAGNVITYKAYGNEIPIITWQCRLLNVSYIKFDSIKFTSIGSSWISTTSTAGTQRNIEFYNCSFESTKGSGASYTGLLLQWGRNYKFSKCYIGIWWNGDAIGIKDCQQVLFEDCDFGQARAPHAVINMIEVSNAVIRNCLFRNPWARVVSIRSRTIAAERVLVEDTAFLDCNWNQTDFHPGSIDTGEQGSDDSVRFMSEKSIFRNNLVIGSNLGEFAPGGGAQAYTSAFQIHYFDAYADHNHIKVYNNVLHKCKVNSLGFLYNTSAGIITAAKYKFRNNSISESQSFGVYIGSTVLPWEDWLFEKNRIADTTKTKTVFISGEPLTSLTVAEAQAAYSTVFKSNITNAPVFTDVELYDEFDADPTLFPWSRLAEFFDAFKETPGSAGKGVGMELAKVTANGTGVTSITVDDSYWFMGTNDYHVGDKVYIGTNSLVTITAVPDSTHITVTPAITVAIDDKIYTEKMTKTPDIGLMPGSLSGSIKELSGVGTIVTAFAASHLSYDTEAFRGTTTIVTAFTGQFIKNDLFSINHNVGDLSEYDSSVTDGGDLSVTTAAALNGTAKGLSVTIDDATVIYGLKNFTWTTQYLRFRLYFDPNTVTMTNGDVFSIVDLQSSGGQESARVRLERTSSTYRITAGMRDDAGAYGTTPQQTISDAPHYIEVEFKRAATSVSVDGVTKLWIDGTLLSTVSNQDVFDVARPVKALIGAARGIDAGTSGTVFIDEIVFRDGSVEIGA